MLLPGVWRVVGGQAPSTDEKGETMQRGGRRWRRLSGAFAGVLALPVGVASLTGGPQGSAAAATRAERIGQAPRLPAGTHVVAALPPSTTLHVDIVLKPRDPAALASFAAEVSTPGSPLYRRFLPRGAFAGRFGPADSEIRAVEAQLRADGLRYGHLSGDHLSLPVTATASALERAFHTSLDQVRLPSGRLAYANTSAPLLGGVAATATEAVIGLDNLAVPAPVPLLHSTAALSRRAAPNLSAGAVTACSAAQSTALNYGSYLPGQLASAYGMSGLYNQGDEGAGVTIALFELERDSPTDIAAYQACYGTSTKVVYTKVDGGASGSAYGVGEAALDIEDLIGLAPKATIDVYQGPNSSTGAYDTYNEIVSNDVAKVVSTSWGLCEAVLGRSAANAESVLFQQAAAQGQSVFAAAGDSGAEDCGTSSPPAVDDPASQPYVTGVGGTTLTSAGPPPTERVWYTPASGTSQAAGGGGGISQFWPMPVYQSSAPSAVGVVNSLSLPAPCTSTSGYCREVPDVSADADPNTGYVIYWDGSWYAFGGTSAAAPLWAAVAALTDASSACSGRAIGFADPALYHAAAVAYASDFHDVTKGDNSLTATSTLYPATSGYDMASGLGSPDAANLASTLCAASQTAADPVSVTDPGPVTSRVGSPVSLQIRASDTLAGATLHYSATGLPAGLSISSSSGLISGVPTAAESYTTTVTATDGSANSASARFTWNVEPALSCPAAQLFKNAGFETGTPPPWTATPGVVVSNTEAAHREVARFGSWFAWLGRGTTRHSYTLSQTVKIPAKCATVALSYYRHIDTSERTSKAVDTLRVQVLGRTGRWLWTPARYSNLQAGRGYGHISINMSRYAGWTITVRFLAEVGRHYGGTTNFCVDGTGFSVR